MIGEPAAASAARLALPEVAVVERVEAVLGQALERRRERRQADPLAGPPRPTVRAVHRRRSRPRGPRASATTGAGASTAAMNRPRPGSRRGPARSPGEDRVPRQPPEAGVGIAPRPDGARDRDRQRAALGGHRRPARAEAPPHRPRRRPPEPFSATCSPRAASQISQNASPPIPQPLGTTTPRTAFVAIAASTAEPPAQDVEPGRRRQVVRRDDRAVRPRGPAAPASRAGRRSCGASSAGSAGTSELVLVAAQLGQRQEGDAEQDGGRDEHPVDAARPRPRTRR